MSYQVQFLDDKEFEALPYRDMQEKVGVADPSTMKAFVRKTGISALDLFNAAHELEHLEDGHEGTHADHYDPEHNVYYKGFGNVLSAIAPIALSFLVPGIGTALGGALGGFGSGLSGIGSSIASGLGSVPGIGGALGGAARTVGGALGSVGQGIGKGLGINGSQSAAYHGGAGSGAASATSADTSLATGAPNVIKSGGGFGSALGDIGKALSSGNILGSFGEQQQPSYNFGFGGNGSYSPQVSQSPSANVIPGASGSGSGGGPGGSPGSVGGGQVSKIRQQYEEENSPNPTGFNGGLK